MPPLHRSILFWLGLFVLSFLLWAWADSRHHFTRWIHMPAPDRALTFGSSDSALHFDSIASLPSSKSSTIIPPPPAYPFYLRFPLPPSQRKPWFRSPRRVVIVPPNDQPGIMGFDTGSASKPLYIRTPVRTVSLALPYWLLITLYLPVWLGASAWRARKIARHRRALLLPAQPQSDL